MVFIFKLKEGDCSCEGCARKIKKSVTKMQGVESALVNRVLDENGNYGVTLIVEGSLDPAKIVKNVGIKTKRGIVLVSHTKEDQPKPTEVKHPSAPIAKNSQGEGSFDNNGVRAELWMQLNQLAGKNLEKAEKLQELGDQCGNLQALLHAALRRKNELERRKHGISNIHHSTHRGAERESAWNGSQNGSLRGIWAE